jgi:site-specific recombinase XerD
MRIAQVTIARLSTHGSARVYARHLACFFSFMRQQARAPIDADEEDLDVFFMTVRHLAPKTQNSIHGVLSSYFRRLASRQKNTWSPMEDRKRPSDQPLTPTPALTKQQAQQLLDSIAADFGDPDRDLISRRDYAMLALMIFCCMRATEVTDVKWKGIGRSDGNLTLSFIGKGRKPATIGLPDPVFRAISMYQKAYETKAESSLVLDDPIFLDVRGALKRAKSRKNRAPLPGLTERTISRIVSDRISDLELNIVAGMPAARFAAHCLRATGATLALEGGADLLDIQIIMRHVQLETTRQYIRGLEQRRTTVSSKIGLSLRGFDEDPDEAVDGASLNGTLTTIDSDEEPKSSTDEPGESNSASPTAGSGTLTQPAERKAA